MVDLDKQFAAMADVSEEDTAYDFVIDEDLRVIAVPERGVVLGVEGDKDVNRVRFRMNRHYRGTDLSGFNIRINYRSAEDEINYFQVTEKTVTDDAIYFVWLVGADTVAAKGTVYFVARFFTAEEGGTITQEFNTTLGNARTLEGLVVDTQADDKPVKDLLAQLEYDLKTYTAPFVQQAKSYAENSAQSAINSAASANQAATYADTAQTGAQNAQASADKAESAQKKAQALALEVDAKVHTDPSLTIEGAPADAKATGDSVKGMISANVAKTLIANALAEDHAKIKFWISVDSTSPAAMFGGTWEEIAPDRVLMGASRSHAAGTTAEAGLPNIAGSLSETSNDGKASPFRGNKNAISSIGALAVTEASSPFCGFAGYEGSVYDISFDASRSNSIYGSSDTVQPAAYYVHIWRRVA